MAKFIREREQLREQVSQRKQSTHDLPVDFQVVGDIFAVALQHGGNFERLRSFYEYLGKNRLMAQSAVRQVFHKREPEERTRWLRFAKDFFQQADPRALEKDQLSMKFC